MSCGLEGRGAILGGAAASRRAIGAARSNNRPLLQSPPFGGRRPSLVFQGRNWFSKAKLRFSPDGEVRRP